MKDLFDYVRGYCDGYAKGIKHKKEKTEIKLNIKSDYLKELDEIKPFPQETWCG